MLSLIHIYAGMGMPIGGVIAADGVVIPNAVGVDIGCGMAYTETNIKAVSYTHLDVYKRQAYATPWLISWAHSITCHTGLPMLC